MEIETRSPTQQATNPLQSLVLLMKEGHEKERTVTLLEKSYLQLMRMSVTQNEHSRE